LTDGAEVSQGISAIGTGAEVSGQFGPSKKPVPNCLETLGADNSAPFCTARMITTSDGQIPNEILLTNLKSFNK